MPERDRHYRNFNRTNTPTATTRITIITAAMIKVPGFAEFDLNPGTRGSGWDTGAGVTTDISGPGDMANEDTGISLSIRGIGSMAGTESSNNGSIEWFIASGGCIRISCGTGITDGADVFMMGIITGIEGVTGGSGIGSAAGAGSVAGKGSSNNGSIEWFTASGG
jgi:hypothetical protein